MKRLLIVAGVCLFVTGCSFKTEFGYHGQTGRDDRTQTQLLAEHGGSLNSFSEQRRKQNGNGY